MMGTILLICTIAMQIFVILDMPFLSTIHSYTIGVWFGYYNPLFYIFLIYLALLMILQEKMKVPKWIKLSTTSYWFLVISIIFIGSSSGYYQNKIGWKSMGSKPWKAFEIWFEKFTNDENAKFWNMPHWTNGGVVGAFCFAFSAMITSGIGALMISILLTTTSISLLITGTIFGFYKQIITSIKLSLRNKKIKEKNKLNLNQFEKPLENNKTKKDKIEKDFPFDDPFEGE